MNEIELHSNSIGDPARFLTLSDLEHGLANLPVQPKETGKVMFIIRRLVGGHREILSEIELSPELGVPGDSWGRQKEPTRDAQIAVVQSGVARLIANGQSLALFGDSLFLDIDLSQDNLPAQSPVQVGDAILDISPLSHNGCLKFKARFGQDTLRFVSMPQHRHLNLRGIYMRVIRAGSVRTGDSVRILNRGSSRISNLPP